VVEALRSMLTAGPTGRASRVRSHDDSKQSARQSDFE
jgi:hypothetical protein